MPQDLKLPLSHVALPAVVIGLFVAACNTPTRPVADKPARDPYLVHMDRGENGAAVNLRAGERPSASSPPRALAFEMIGFAGEVASGSSGSAGASQEARSAARQAAIINAFGRALIEARAARGQSVADFAATMGPRLTVTHRALPEARDEFEVRVISRGVETVFHVRDGRLMHPPHDLDLIERIFDETNGEFALLATDWTTRPGTCTATVGCYVPAGYDAAIAGDVTGERDAP